MSWEYPTVPSSAAIHLAGTAPSGLPSAMTLRSPIGLPTSPHHHTTDRVHVTRQQLRSCSMEPTNERPDDTSTDDENESPTAIADDGIAPLINNTGADEAGAADGAPTG